VCWDFQSKPGASLAVQVAVQGLGCATRCTQHNRQFSHFTSANTSADSRSNAAACGHTRLVQCVINRGGRKNIDSRDAAKNAKEMNR